jgi:hypothetical protein
MNNQFEYEAVADSGKRQLFTTGAVRDIQTGKGRFDLLPPKAIIRLAKHFENGAAKYGDRNWERGIPVSRYLDSALRHLFKYLDGYKEEDHLAAALWNISCALQTEMERPELQDIPKRQEKTHEKNICSAPIRK